MMEKIKNFIKRYFYNTGVIDNNIELGGGLLGIGEQDTDFVFGADIDLEQELKSRGQVNRQVIYEYNQGAQYETRNWCTVYSAITELSWLFDYKFSQDEIFEIGRTMIADGKLDPDRGAWLHQAIDHTRKWWNEKFPDRQVESYRIEYLDTNLRNILTHVNPRLTQLGYRTSTELFQEIQTTGVASKKTYRRIGGHAVSQWGLNTINNYYGKVFSGGKKFRNRFSFTYLEDLIKAGVVFNFGYMFLKKK